MFLKHISETFLSAERNISICLEEQDNTSLNHMSKLSLCDLPLVPGHPSPPFLLTFSNEKFTQEWASLEV